MKGGKVRFEFYCNTDNVGEVQAKSEASGDWGKKGCVEMNELGDNWAVLGQ